MYNFTVEDWHNYFVSDSSVLVHNADCIGGAGWAAKYSSNWQDASLDKAINEHAPNTMPTQTNSGKNIYTNQDTGIQVVHDVNGNYFRIQDTSISGTRAYLDINGKRVPNNIILPNGKQMGLSKPDYQKLTHFNNID